MPVSSDEIRLVYTTRQLVNEIEPALLSPLMSTSSTTACSRSSSPATPDATDNLDRAITQEVVNAWCHSLSQDGFFVPDEHYENDKEHVAQLDLGDLIQEDAYDECVCCLQ